jgi:hypothetical protein
VEADVVAVEGESCTLQVGIPAGLPQHAAVANPAAAHDSSLSLSREMT